MSTETGIRVERTFSAAGTHPYDEVTWLRTDVRLTDRDGDVVFEQTGVEFPDSWSANAVTIVTTRYFRGVPGTPERESSLRHLIDRVVRTYAEAGLRHGYFDPETINAEVFAQELTWLLLHQHFAFNSPVWFNVGTKAPQAVSACYILAVDDTLESILDWYKEEGLIFKGGSGSGVNLSRIRSSRELLSSGGTASGPVSFMRGADASAGTIKSGGSTRRAAKMILLDVDHPDIAEFIGTKVREEAKIRALRDAGFDVGLGGRDILTVQYQNANNSVRISDEFMRAVEEGGKHELRARTTGEVVETVDARALFRSIAQAAWECADPGVQYDDTINDWHTNPNKGRITASNPCSEFLSLDNSSCNLASLNLMKFLADDGTFQVGNFVRATELVTTAMDISICFADYPTEKIAQVTRAYRQLGIGYANLGALLMASGLPYDSEAGRQLAASITSLMTAVAYRRSAELAGVVGAYDGYERDAEAHTVVMRRHAAAHNVLPQDEDSTFVGIRIISEATYQWRDALSLGAAHGWRNAQASLLAPTGTIGLMMDCDTTGVEPDLALVKHKQLFGGGSIQIVNQTVRRALQTLGYQGEEVDRIIGYIAEHGHVTGSPDVLPEHYPVFDCAMGQRSIAPMGHVLMLAAVQPFLSGAVSKTINMPTSATVEDVEEVYLRGWKLGLKSLAIYRDNCKVGQPLSDAGARNRAAENQPQTAVPARRRLPRRRPSQTSSFSVGGAEGYLTTSSYPDDGLGEVFLKMSKQGSTLAGLIDAFSIAVSVGLQYGVPLETLASKFIGMRFDPAGVTDDPDLRLATSVVDYVFRRLVLDFVSGERRAELGILTADERTSREGETTSGPGAAVLDTPLCSTCGTHMRPSGTCYVCEVCGSTSGCS